MSGWEEFFTTSCLFFLYQFFTTAAVGILRYSSGIRIWQISLSFVFFECLERPSTIHHYRLYTFLGGLLWVRHCPQLLFLQGASCGVCRPGHHGRWLSVTANHRARFPSQRTCLSLARPHEGEHQAEIKAFYLPSFLSLWVSVPFRYDFSMFFQSLAVAQCQKAETTSYLYWKFMSWVQDLVNPWPGQVPLEGTADKKRVRKELFSYGIQILIGHHLRSP